MIDIDEFREYLKIDKLDLDEEIIRQPSLLYEVSEALADAIAKRDLHKDELARTDAELDLSFREELEKSNKKYTEGQIKSLILNDKYRQNINGTYLLAKGVADKLEALKDAFQDRGYRLRDLASLYVSNYYQESSVRSDANQDAVVYKRQRARLAEARAKRGE